MKNLVMALVLSAYSIPTFAATLNCGGTEPFWSAQVTDKTIKVSSPVEEQNMTLKVVSKTQAAGFVDNFAMVIKTKYTSLSVIAGDCSDGMSDLTHSHHAVFDYNGTVLAGCCNIYDDAAATAK